MKNYSNVIAAYIASKDGLEYLCAECNYGHVGVDDAIFAKRQEGEKQWRYIGVFENPKQACALLFIFGKENPPKLTIDKEQFLQIMAGLD